MIESSQSQSLPTSPDTSSSTLSGEATQPEHLLKQMRSTSCPGYELVFPPGQSPYTSYPFALHNTQALPWEITLGKKHSENQMILHSINCKRSDTISNDAGESQTCISCRSLHNNTTIMGIWHRALDGAHDNTPWSFLGMMQLTYLLEQKNRQIDALRLRGLNAGRALAIRDRNIQGWKRFAIRDWQEQHASSLCPCKCRTPQWCWGIRTSEYHRSGCKVKLQTPQL